MRIAITTRLLLVVSMFLTCNAAAENRKSQISEDEIKRYLNMGADCEISFNSLEYFDFTGDGNDEAVVVAFTCSTGTAGPDVHAVYSRQPDGSLKELKIPTLTPRQSKSLQGRVFENLKVEHGLLVDSYEDTSGRDDPLTVEYRWDRKTKRFYIAKVYDAPRYPTSFDCDKAVSAIDNAICYSQELAQLDVQLAAKYRQRLTTLNGAERDSLIAEQKSWIQERNRTCQVWTIVECLIDSYTARVKELGVKPKTK